MRTLSIYSLNFYLLHTAVLIVCITFSLSLCSVMSDSLWCYELQSARLLCPWDFPGKHTGVGCHFLPQWIFLTQVSNPRLLHLLHCQVGSLPFCHLSLCTKSLVFIYLKVLVHRLCPNPYSSYTLPLRNTSLITLSMSLFVSFWSVNDLQLLLVPIIKHSDFVLYISKWSQ